MNKDITKISDTVDWLYSKGCAKHIAFRLKGKPIQYNRPPVHQFLFGLFHIFDNPDVDKAEFTWLIWNDRKSREVEHRVVFYKDGSATVNC